MCCRYWMDDSSEMRDIAEQMNRSPLMSRWQANGRIVTRGEIRPTDIAPVIASNRAGKQAVFPMKWGFTGRSLLVNARVETASVKPMFKDAWANHRCVVPASWYFEWEHTVDAHGKKRTGDKYQIQPKDGGITWLCGLYRIEQGLPVFVVLTRAPGDSVRAIHDRMPFIIPEPYIKEWISPSARPEALLQMAVTDMAFKKDAQDQESHKD